MAKIIESILNLRKTWIFKSKKKKHKEKSKVLTNENNNKEEQSKTPVSILYELLMKKGKFPEYEIVVDRPTVPHFTYRVSFGENFGKLCNLKILRILLLFDYFSQLKVMGTARRKRSKRQQKLFSTISSTNSSEILGSNRQQRKPSSDWSSRKTSSELYKSFVNAGSSPNLVIVWKWRSDQDTQESSSWAASCRASEPSDHRKTKSSRSSWRLRRCGWSCKRTWDKKPKPKNEEIKFLKAFICFSSRIHSKIHELNNHIGFQIESKRKVYCSIIWALLGHFSCSFNKDFQKHKKSKEKCLILLHFFPTPGENFHHFGLIWKF